MAPPSLPLSTCPQYNDTAGVAASAVVATTEPVGGPQFTLQAGTSVRASVGQCMLGRRLAALGMRVHCGEVPSLADWLPASPVRYDHLLLQAKGDLSGKLAGETIKPISDWVAR